MWKQMDEVRKQRYIKHPYFCPYCDLKEGLQMDQRWADLDIISQVITCAGCHRQWMEVYQLTDVEEMDDVL